MMYLLLISFQQELPTSFYTVQIVFELFLKYLKTASQITLKTSKFSFFYRLRISLQIQLEIVYKWKILYENPQKFLIFLSKNPLMKSLLVLS